MKQQGEVVLAVVGITMYRRCPAAGWLAPREPRGPHHRSPSRASHQRRACVGDRGAISNHGSGFYVPPEMRSRDRKAPGHDGASPAAVRWRRRPIFHTTAERLREVTPTSRGIAYDDGAEPGPGWPHAAILGDLTKNPTMTLAELGAAVVQRYVESYRHGGEIATQSAVDLGQLDDLVEAVDVLARRLLAGIKSAALAAALHGARRRTLQFFDGLYVDLHHLAGNLATSSGNGRVADACRNVPRMIDGEEARSPIIAEGHVGASMAPARGISISFPLFLDRSTFYRQLDFASATRWADFLEALLGRGRASGTR